MNKVLQDKKLQNGSTYFLKDGILKGHVCDNKPVFETVIITIVLHSQLLRQDHDSLGHNRLLRKAHDDLGHNGSSRTYIF